eukprot:818887-Amorphochlora_amoeboformis.AAC.4
MPGGQGALRYQLDKEFDLWTTVSLPNPEGQLELGRGRYGPRIFWSILKRDVKSSCILTVMDLAVLLWSIRLYLCI